MTPNPRDRVERFGRHLADLLVDLADGEFPEPHVEPYPPAVVAAVWVAALAIVVAFWAGLADLAGLI